MQIGTIGEISMGGRHSEEDKDRSNEINVVIEDGHSAEGRWIFLSQNLASCCQKFCVINLASDGTLGVKRRAERSSGERVFPAKFTS
jgi:hypothetical protein